MSKYTSNEEMLNHLNFTDKKKQQAAILSELSSINNSSKFWEAVHDSQIPGHHHHEHEEEKEFEISGNFQKAQTDIQTIIDSITSLENAPSSEQIFTLLAFSKAADQLACDKYHISKRSKDFLDIFDIQQTISGYKSGQKTINIEDASLYLTHKFSLNNISAKIDVIMQSRDSAIEKARHITNSAWEGIAKSSLSSIKPIAEYAPSLMTLGLALGTAQLTLRALDHQEDANILRDNIGAATEAATFFVVVNGILDNLSHALVIAAPATLATAGFEGMRQAINRICHNQTHMSNIVAPAPEITDVEEELMAVSESIVKNINQHNIVLNLEKISDIFQEDSLWEGLRKFQQVYVDNKIESELKSAITDMIATISNSTNNQEIYQILQHNAQNIANIQTILISCQEAYDKEFPGNHVREIVSDFRDLFNIDDILLTEPSHDAENAAFRIKANFGLVPFNERVQEVLPHLPEGEEILLAAIIIGSIFAGRELYENMTGEREEYSDYLINFPEHLFEWLNLEKMYDNLGGGAEFSDAFKDFFTAFNLGENSSHLGIAVAPIFYYLKNGGEMFENMHHTPVNLASYVYESSTHYSQEISKTITGWFHGKEEASTVISATDSLQLSPREIELNFVA